MPFITLIAFYWLPCLTSSTNLQYTTNIAARITWRLQMKTTWQWVDTVVRNFLDEISIWVETKWSLSFTQTFT